MKRNLEIVFIHEVGHYVAQQLNAKKFGTGEVDKILLIEKDNGNFIDYEGRTISKVGINQSAKTPLINLPEKIGEIVYGCYFQSLYLELEFSTCFDFYDTNKRGQQDAKDLVAALSQFKISQEVRVILYPYLNTEYFNYLRTIRGNFEIIFNQNVNEFLIQDKKNYSVDLIKLDNFLQNIFSIHEKDYVNFILKIKDILKWKNPSQS